MSMKTVKLQWVGLTSLGVWETGRRFLIYNMTYMYVWSTVTYLERPKVHNSCSSIILVCQIKLLFDIIVWYLFVSIFMFLQEKSIILQIHLSDSRNLFIFFPKKKKKNNHETCILLCRNWITLSLREESIEALRIGPGC